MLFTFGQYRLDIDTERTSAFYRTARTAAENCSCCYCRNYEQAAALFPDEVKAFFAALGADVMKPAEIWETDYDESGRFAHYNGFYHLCGSMLAGENCWASTYKDKKSEVLALDEDSMAVVTEGFLVGFHENCDLMEENFPTPAIQMEIAFRVPWVLEMTPDEAEEALQAETIKHKKDMLSAVKTLIGWK